MDSFVRQQKPRARAQKACVALAWRQSPSLMLGVSSRWLRRDRQAWTHRSDPGPIVDFGPASFLASPNVRNPPASVILVALVAAGGLIGFVLRYPGGAPPMMFLLAGAFALLMMFAGAAESIAERSQARAGIVSVGCLVYSFVAMLVEPFMWQSIAGGASALIPLLLAFPYLYRCRAWVSAGGVALFLLVAAVMVVNNAISLHHGSGFLSHWHE